MKKPAELKNEFNSVVIVLTANAGFATSNFVAFASGASSNAMWLADLAVGTAVGVAGGVALNRRRTSRNKMPQETLR